MVIPGMNQVVLIWCRSNSFNSSLIWPLIRESPDACMLCSDDIDSSHHAVLTPHHRTAHRQKFGRVSRVE